MRRVLTTVLAAASLLAAPAAAQAARPNVVVIETDDQTMADMAHMPSTRALIGDHGVTFDRSFVSESQCCPSRATFLTGLYAHNHRVLTTQPPFGGYAAFNPSQSLAVWLQRAGYVTNLDGKYFNNYGKYDPTTIPPGWTEWHGLEGPTTYSFMNFRINENGRVNRYVGRYQTDYLTLLAESYIRRRAHGRKPFFLWQTYVAPHIAGPKELLDPPLPSTHPAPLFGGQFFWAKLPRDPSFNEADVTDKPRAIANLRPLGLGRANQITHSWRQRQESLLSVDEGVVRIVRVLREAGVLKNTLLVFTSDNGYLEGQHRVATGKVLAYEPSIRVPLLMRGPGIPAGTHRSQLVWNGDLAPTILAATGARSPWPLDGQSLLPFVNDPTLRSGRAILLEGPPPLGKLDPRPEFVGLRTSRYKYVEWLDGEREFYDLARDPYELDNRANDPAVAGVVSQLAQRLGQLRGCSGSSCRR
jgi:arylsulfatase A-like enzyme